MYFSREKLPHKQTWGWILLACLVFVGISLVTLNWSTSDNISAVRDSWQQYTRESATKADLTRSMTSRLGYGGVIHNLENYLIRNRSFYLATAEEKLSDVQGSLDIYRIQDLSEDERQALDTLQGELSKLAQFVSALSSQNETQQRFVADIMADIPLNRDTVITALATLRGERLETAGSPQSRSLILLELTQAFGLGGMIDSFKETVRNKSPEKPFLQAYSDVVTALEAYKTLDLSERERHNLASIEGVLEAYKLNYTIVTEGHASGRTITAIDRDVFVDDTQAFAAFTQLENAIALMRIAGAETVTNAISYALSENQKRLYGLFTLMLIVVIVAFLALRDNAKKEQELVQKEKASRGTAQRLSRLMDAINVHAIVTKTDLNGRIIFCNEKYSHISGYSMDEILNSSFSLVNSGYHDDVFFQTMWETIKSGKVWTGEIRNMAKNGKIFWVQSTIGPDYNEHGTIIGYTAIETDITEQKRQQERQAEKLQIVQEASRFKSNFFAAMSHNLRTPLNAILGFSEALYQQIYGSLGSTKNREYAALIHSSGETLLRLIDDILDASKAESGKYQMTDENVSVTIHLSDLMQKFTAISHQHGISIRYEYDSNIKTLQADSNALEQITSNLISTALKYCQSGEEITVSYKLDKEGQLTICVSDPSGLFCNGAKSELEAGGEIQDSSITGGSIRGTGLGLYIVSLFAELHGGEFIIHDKKTATHEPCVGVVFPAKRVNSIAA